MNSTDAVTPTSTPEPVDLADGGLVRPRRPRMPAAAGALGKALFSSPGIGYRTAVLGGELASAAVGRSGRVPAKGDRRFADTTWSDNPLYRRLAQGYLALEHHITDAVEQSDVDWRTRQRARFAAGVVASALAPTNTLPGNPAALKRALETGGGSLVRGGRNLVHDVRHNKGMPRQVDASGFTVGENVGATPGEVVFRNELLEIIQYSPTTPNVRAMPLLVVWSVVNRYYVLDLGPDRSFVQYALDQGLQVFVTSWRNPTKEQRDWSLDTYAAALLEAVDAIREVTGSDQVGTVGLCAGGQLLAATMAHLAEVGDDRIGYACFGVSQLDMGVPNPGGIALHPALTGLARAGTKASGVVDGRDISAVFSWLRPNELVWGSWVNNYLLGNPPPSFDILAWNSDTTRVAGAMMRDLLSIAEHNQLAEPGALTVLGTPVDLGRVKTDCYVVGAETDHLVPWRGAYRTTELLGGDSTFVLSGGGHIQHLVNPPGNPKAYYRTGPTPGPDSEAWLAGSEQQSGTWWTHWAEWVQARSGAEVPAPAQLGSTTHPPLEAAPGRYVRER